MKVKNVKQMCQGFDSKTINPSTFNQIQTTAAALNILTKIEYLNIYPIYLILAPKISQLGPKKLEAQFHSTACTCFGPALVGGPITET
jgi:hypothetical protein